MEAILGYLFHFLMCAFMAGWCLWRKTPVHFWAGTTVKAEEVTDVKKYNRANAKLWLSYGAIAFLPILFHLAGHDMAALFVYLFAMLWGLVPFIIAYIKIYKKYSVKEEKQ